MSPAGLLVATALLWTLTAFVVMPLANAWLERRLREPAYAHLAAPELAESDRAALDGLATRCFIAADVLVLGLAGLVAGLLGYWFVGVATRLAGWPGVIAFIVASLAGVSLRSAGGVP